MQVSLLTHIVQLWVRRPLMKLHSKPRAVMNSQLYVEYRVSMKYIESVGTRDQARLTCRVHPRWTRVSRQPLLIYESRDLSEIASLAAKAYSQKSCSSTLGLLKSTIVADSELGGGWGNGLGLIVFPHGTKWNQDSVLRERTK